MLPEHEDPSLNLSHPQRSWKQAKCLEAARRLSEVLRPARLTHAAGEQQKFPVSRGKGEICPGFILRTECLHCGRCAPEFTLTHTTQRACEHTHTHT